MIIIIFTFSQLKIQIQQMTQVTQNFNVQINKLPIHNQISLKTISPKKLKNIVTQLKYEQGGEVKIMIDGVVSPRIRTLVIKMVKQEVKAFVYVLHKLILLKKMRNSFNLIKNNSEKQVKLLLQNMIQILNSKKQNNEIYFLVRLQLSNSFNNKNFLKGFLKANQNVDSKNLEKIKKCLENKLNAEKKSTFTKNKYLANIYNNSFEICISPSIQAIDKIRLKILTESFIKIKNQSKFKIKWTKKGISIIKNIISSKVYVAIMTKLKMNFFVKKDKFMTGIIRVALKNDTSDVNKRTKDLLYEFQQRKKINTQMVQKNQQQNKLNLLYIERLKKQIQVMQKKNLQKELYFKQIQTKSILPKSYIEQIKQRQFFNKVKTLYQSIQNSKWDPIKKSALIYEHKINISLIQNRSEYQLYVNKNLKDEVSSYEENMSGRSTKEPKIQIKNSSNDYIESENNSLKKLLHMYIKQSFDYKYIENLRVSYNKLKQDYDQINILLKNNEINKVKKIFSMI